MRTERIPLFPLELVLFPGMELPLHIFEPRYRELTRFCLENRREFGVVLARRDGIATVGCTAELLHITRTYPDGRMDIETQGRIRFQTLELFQEASYLEARVEYLEETQNPSLSPDDPVLLEHFARCYRVAIGPDSAVPELQPPDSLAYQVAAELPLDIEFKQTLLEIRSEFDRRRLLNRILPRWAEEVEKAKRSRQMAAGNGHGGAGHN